MVNFPIPSVLIALDWISYYLLLLLQKEWKRWAAKYKQNVQQYVSRNFPSVLLSFNENTVVQIKTFVNKMKIVSALLCFSTQHVCIILINNNMYTY